MPYCRNIHLDYATDDDRPTTTELAESGHRAPNQTPVARGRYPGRSRPTSPHRMIVSRTLPAQRALSIVFRHPANFQLSWMSVQKVRVVRSQNCRLSVLLMDRRDDYDDLRAHESP